jgi:hypothetical protein
LTRGLTRNDAWGAACAEKRERSAYAIPEQERAPALGFTAWVNAHGGILETPVRIRAGQKVTLVIPQSKKEAGARVVQVQKASDESFATSFEFDRPSPEFWPIASRPLDWGVV